MSPCYESLFDSIEILQSLWVVLTEQAVDKITSRKWRDGPFGNRRVTGRTQADYVFLNGAAVRGRLRLLEEVL
jgi:hypothetical protein